MNWYKKANLWDDIRKYGPSSKEPVDINDPKIEWLANKYDKSKEYIAKALDLNQSNYPHMTDWYNRDYFTNQYGWSVPEEKAINKIKNFVGNDTILEVGSGHGLWAKLMKEAGINIVATDFLSGEEAKTYLGRPRDKYFADVEDLSGEDAVKKYSNANILMMSWPPYDTPFAHNVLRIFKGRKLIFVGECSGGCTANEDFFNLLANEWNETERVEIPQWSGIHDDLYFYERIK